jgi:hypothetical protein
MDEIWTALNDVTFPASREQLVEAATAAGARPEIVSRLETLPREHYADQDELGRHLVRSRAESNTGLVTISAEVCESCGFPRYPGKPHSCIEEKARFAESAQSVTDEFEIPDESGRQTPP